VIWMQHWTNVLFLHFAAPAEELRRHLPARIEIDTFDGQAWISCVLFRLNLRPAGLPFVPGLSSLLELNVRTYVRHRGQSGICFLKMYADNWLAICASRLLTPLSYEFAALTDHRRANGARYVECKPVDSAGGALAADVMSSRDLVEARPGSLDFWLLERYRLFVVRRDGTILAADVEHPPWRAATVAAMALQHNFHEVLGLPTTELPVPAHESPGVAVRFKTFRVVAAPCCANAAAALEPARAVGHRDGPQKPHTFRPAAQR
jgi:uncharacterized protein YqjF (DUF2071 family)